MERIEVRFEGRGMGLAAAVHIGRHVHPKAKPEAAPPPVPTGIDYLSLIAARRDAELARPISYADLSAATANSDIGAAVNDHTEEDRS